MNISPNEAQKALSDIQAMELKTRRSIASGGTYITLIVTGTIWLIGFVCNQFLTGPILKYIWIGLSVIGSITAVFLGLRVDRRLRSPSSSPMAKRIGLFWIFLACFAVATILVAQPADSKQLTMLVVLFYLFGQMAMGMPFSFATMWWALPVAALALVGYFFFSAIFFLWMGVLVGGGMIGFGLFIHRKW